MMMAFFDWLDIHPLPVIAGVGLLTIGVVYLCTVIWAALRISGRSDR